MLRLHKLQLKTFMYILNAIFTHVYTNIACYDSIYLFNIIINLFLPCFSSSSKNFNEVFCFFFSNHFTYNDIIHVKLIY